MLKPAALLITAALTLSLAACGGDDSDTPSTPSTPTAAASPATTNPTAPDEQFSEDDWPLTGRTRENQRYATQTEIDKDSISRLGMAWSNNFGGDQYLQTALPVVVDGVLYVTTSTNEVYAFDAATGETKWKYTPQVDFTLSTGVGGYGVVNNRGVSVADGKVYLLTYDGTLKGISANTGEELFSSRVLDPATGAYENMQPQVYDGKVYVGSSGSDQGVRGFVAAYDGKTGKQVWRWYTIPKVGQGWRAKGTAGGTVYMAPTIDTQNGNVVFGTASPAPTIDGSKRPGPNLYTASVVALKADTGKLVWYHQESPHDLWGYDAASPVILADVDIDGQTRRIATQTGKNGFLYMLDAQTGEEVHPALAFSKQAHSKPTRKGSLQCPGPIGGSQLDPKAYSPRTQAEYITSIEFCFLLQVSDDKTAEGSYGGKRVVPSDATPFGRFDAVDLKTGRFLWRKKMPTPMAGGAVATASDLVFTIDQKGVMYAFDARSGDEVWKANLGLAGAAAPIVYAVDGKEYVAAAIGGSALTSSNKFGPVGSAIVVLTLDGKKIVPQKPTAAPDEE